MQLASCLLGWQFNGSLSVLSNSCSFRGRALAGNSESGVNAMSSAMPALCPRRSVLAPRDVGHFPEWTTYFH
eukprot:11179448-Lingulodinium_polyedra.AAC.1